MGNICKALSCCCGNNEGKIPEITLSINANCCKDNKTYRITISDSDDIDKIKEMLDDFHKKSLVKKQSSSTIQEIK